MARRKLVEMGFAKNSVNMEEIARKLDLSISTVSRALGGVPGVHSVTRERVVDMARELGYGISGSDKTNKHRNILVLAQLSGAQSFQRFFTGMSSCAVGCNCSVLAHCVALNCCEEVLDPLRQPLAMRQGTVDGVIFVYKWPDRVVSEIGKKLPAVSLVHQYSLKQLDRVGIDNESGITEVIRHLAGLGHRKIGFFGLNAEVSWSRSRYGAYVEALIAQGLDVRFDRTLSVSTTEILSEVVVDVTRHVATVKRLVSSGVTAMVCSSDMLGYSLMESLTKGGVQVPRDISLSGFHVESSPFSERLPVLTSVSVSTEELGAAALRRIVHRLDFPDESYRTILLPCELMVGSSTAALAGDN